MSKQSAPLYRDSPSRQTDPTHAIFVASQHDRSHRQQLARDATDSRLDTPEWQQFQDDSLP